MPGERKLPKAFEAGCDTGGGGERKPRGKAGAGAAGRESSAWPFGRPLKKRAPLDAEMPNDELKAQRAVLWSRRFSLLYAMGVWTVIGYFVSRSVRFREIPLEGEKKEEEEEEKGGQPPPPPPPDHNKYSRSV